MFFLETPLYINISPSSLNSIEDKVKIAIAKALGVLPSEIKLEDIVKRSHGLELNVEYQSGVVVPSDFVDQVQANMRSQGMDTNIIVLDIGNLLLEIIQNNIPHHLTSVILMYYQ